MTNPRPGLLQYNATLFADDIAIVSSSIQELRLLVHVCEEHARSNHYRFAPLKCVILTNIEEQFEILLHDQAIPKCQEFKFLGSWFDAQGFHGKTHVDKSIEKSLTASNILKSVGVNGRTYSADAIIKIYKTFVRPILEWGSNLHPYHHKTKQRLEQTQTRIVKSLLSVGTRTSTAAVLMLAGLETMTLRCDFLRARTLYRFSTNDRSKLSRLCFDSCVNSSINNLATTRLSDSPAWKKFQETASMDPEAPTASNSVKKQLLLSQMQDLHKKDQLMCQLITPSNRMSNLFLAKTSNPPLHITRRQKRLLVLWRLSVLPLHPYKVCKNCFDIHAEEPNIAPASRDHIASCYKFDLILPDPEDWKPTAITNPLASRLDLLLDAAPRLTNEPPLLTTLKWQSLGNAIEDICDATLGTEDYRETMRELGLTIPSEFRGFF